VQTKSGSSVLGLLNVAPSESLFQTQSQSNQSIESAFAEAKEATEGLLDDLLRLDTALREQNEAVPACEYEEHAYEDNAEQMSNSMSDYRNDVIGSLLCLLVFVRLTKFLNKKSIFSSFQRNGITRHSSLVTAH
jgi:predicted RNase H-like HicB family nuclease